MTNFAYGAVQGAPFAVYADPPWLLHLSGELDLVGASALDVALEDPIRHGGTIGLELSELTFMDSTGINLLVKAAGLLGKRGRIVLFNPSRSIRRLIEICGLGRTFDINDHHPSTAPHLDQPDGRLPAPRGGDRRHGASPRSRVTGSAPL